MGTIFTLDATTKATIATVLDDLITEFGKTCKLVYPSSFVNCDNCILDPIGNKSSNFWKHGGPVPFPSGGACPLCNGTCKIANEVSESMKLLCAFTPKAFFKPIPNINLTVPKGLVQTKGYLVDLPKILRAEYLIFQIEIEGITGKRFKLWDEPADISNIIQGRYFVATWERT